MNKLKVLVVALVLTACTPSGDVQRYEMVSKSRWNTATIEVNWLPSVEAVSRKCLELGTNDGPNEGGEKKYDGCARSKPSNEKICEVYVVEPSNFDDEVRLEKFGHEVWHCFGARHK